MIMSENLNPNKITKPEINYITVEIKRTKIDKNGHIYEVVEEHQVPDFLANILTDSGNTFIDDNN